MVLVLLGFIALLMGGYHWGFLFDLEDMGQLFNWYQQFSSEKEENCFPKVARHRENRPKMTILKGGVDGLSYFSFISVILFSNQDHI